MQPTIGIVGLGAMGFNAALNLARNGFSVAGFDVDSRKTAALGDRGPEFVGVNSLDELLRTLDRPRRILLLAPAERTESIIALLAPALDGADVLVDMGNSFFRDTERRQRGLAAVGLNLLGCGVSGGYAGAFTGPCIMPGGDHAAWSRIAPVFQAAAAKVNDVPCTAYIGPGGAGHFVKMVHNGIYYADSQIIAESYHILSRLLGFSPSQLAPIYSAWDRGRLESYLIEMTADILGQFDELTGRPVVEVIMDRAEQKGTGKWASQTSMDVGAPLGTINAALFARQVSSLKAERIRASAVLAGPTHLYRGDGRRLIDATRDALYLSKVCSYAQGFTLLKMGSDEYGFGLNLKEIATIWRGGCLIRAGLLEEIRAAFQCDPALPNLLLDPAFSSVAAEMQDAFRFVLRTAIEHGIPVPAMSASLAYYDSYRTATLPANLIQAQRDFFGAHGFERTDASGQFHRDWQTAKAGAL